MTNLIVIQARTNSSRLPGKVLLPINSIPIVVLAAKRAGNRGIPVIVATSIEKSDDDLVEVLINHDVDFHRGSLEDPLSRIVGAAKDYKDSTIIIRLTADNIFPDGALINEVKEYFIDSKLKYLLCNGLKSGLPYGVSIEITLLKYLRLSNDANLSQSEREHVTPHIIEKYGLTVFEKYKYLNKGQYRATIDAADDYYNILKVFSGIPNPIQISVFDLIDRLAPDNRNNYKLNRLVLGTAQFGMDYGIANMNGRPSKVEVESILKIAISSGMKYLDTARAYGDSEKVIGEVLDNNWKVRVQFITKLDPLNDLMDNTSPAVIEERVISSVNKSISMLGKTPINTLLIHREEHIRKWSNQVWLTLESLKNEGLILELGVSIQNPEELLRVIDEESIKIIQMPYNIFDWRWDKAIKRIIQVKKEREILIHTRSSLLQGLLTTNSVGKWKKANENSPEIIIKWINDKVEKFDRIGNIDLCLGFLRSQSWIDGIVIGMDSLEQLQDNIMYFDQPLLKKNEINEIYNTRPLLNENTLDPIRWNVL